MKFGLLKKSITVLMTVFIMAQMLYVPVFAAPTATEISNEIKDVHAKIIEANKGQTLNGYCAKYVSWYLKILGITNGFEAKGNGKDVYDNWAKSSVTSGGYTIKAYPGSNCLENIIAENGNEIYNVLVGFDYSPYGAGKTYGHVMFIHAIIDGTIYFSESGTWNGKKTGTVFALDLNGFKSMYSGHTYDGAIYFTNSESSNTVDISEGVYSLRTACDTNKALDVFAQSSDDKANIHIWDVGSQDSQKWNIVKNGAYYTIINVNSGKALDVENGSTASGTNVWQYKPNSTNAQKWRFEDAGDGYYYIRSASGLYLDLYGADTTNGTNIAVYNGNGGGNNQKWKLVPCYKTDLGNSFSSDDWGAWSEWTTTPVAATDNRQVEVGTAYVYYHYVLEDEDGCGAYPINKATMKANGFTFNSEYYHEYISMTELQRDTTGRLTYIVNGSRKIYDRFPNQHCSSDYNFIYSNYLYYKGTTQKYRYRDRIISEHTHSFSEVKYETAHPHNAYKVCTTCGEKVYEGGGVCDLNCEECNPTLYYTLYYDANGGIEPPSPQTVKSGETIKVSGVEPSKKGYSFAGWSYDRNGNNADIFGGSEITVAGDKTLYAVWNNEPSKTMILTIGSTAADVFGKTMYNDVAPLIVDNRTMLPARFVAENLGAEVIWNAKKECVIIESDEHYIELYVGSNIAKADGETVTLDSAPFIRNGRTYCPVRFICEALGAGVEWLSDEQKVVITV